MSKFELTPYPYDELNSIKQIALSKFGEVIDLSIGTPIDDTPNFVIDALCNSKDANGYPPSIGTVTLRSAIKDWYKRRLDVDIDIDLIAAVVGTKEFVASLPTYLRLMNPEKDVVLGPSLAYPTYEFGAKLAGLKYVGIPPRHNEDRSMDLESINEEYLKRALLMWVNSPSNPDGHVESLREFYEFANQNSILTVSDECYMEYVYGVEAESILQHGIENVLALHSLSKRSNAAGLRVGFYAGDRSYVLFLEEIRKHAGLMVPGPVQSAGVAALSDDSHVEVQRERYFERLKVLADAFSSIGIDVNLPKGGFYLFIKAPDIKYESVLEAAKLKVKSSLSWKFTAFLALTTGVLVSPGEFYGSDGTGYVRIAVVQTDEKISLASKRISQLEGRQFT